MSPSVSLLRRTCCLAALGLAACSSSKVSLARTEVRADSLRYVIGKPAPFTGLLVVPRDRSTGVSVNMPFVNGLREGTAEGVHGNGKRAFTETWKAGKREGLRQEWDTAGHLSRSEHFVAGLREGLMQDFAPDGKVILERPMRADEQDGVVKTWYPSGQLKSEAQYRSGRLQGVMTLWYANGQKRYEGPFAAGKPDGEIREWFETGQLKASTGWKAGIAQGRFTRWYENGQKRMEGIYRDSQRTAVKYWNFDGKPMTRPDADEGPAVPHPPAG